MCTIDKILIKGIRSFSTDNPSVVEFYKPLTLIVGHNGAGKTTIIECLKQVCTGELPPNTRSGQSFIHDPKVAGEMEVKAQIKLRLNTATSQPVVIIRSFQLTQKKTTLQFKAIDQVVQTVNKETNQKEALSYRCQDMDRIVPAMMGVSKAILENVIFVHQEDSNWPLSEGQVLKRKFDDIFAATKYTKALEALRKLRLEKTQEQKECKLKVDHLTTHITAAHRLKSEITDGQEKQQKLEQQIRELDVLIAAKEEMVSKLSAQIQAFGDLNRSHAEVKALHNSAIARNAERKVQLIAAYSEDDLSYDMEELKQFETELQPQLNAAIQALETSRQKITACESKEEALRRQLGQEQSREAHLNAQAEAHKANITDRDQALRTGAADAGLESLPRGNLSDDAVNRFMTTLQQTLSSEEETLSKKRTENQQQDDELRKAVDEVSRQMTDASQTAKMKQQVLRENDGKINRLQQQIETSTASPLEASEAADAESAAQKRLEDRQEALNRQNFTQELDELRASMDSIQSKISILRQERDRLSVAADEGTRLSVLRRERTQKQAQIDTLLSHRKQQICNLANCTAEEMPAPGELKKVIGRLMTENHDKLQEVSQALQRAQAQANSTQGSLTACTQLLERQQQEAEQLTTSTSETMTNIYDENPEQDNLEELVQQEEKAMDKKKGELERIKTLRINNKIWTEVANRDNKCELCERHFHGNEKQTFLQVLASKMERLPSTISDLKGLIKTLDSKVSELRKMQPGWVRLNQLQTEILPKTEEEQRELEEKSGQEASRAAQLHEEAQKLKKRDQDLQELRTEVAWPIDRQVTEVAGLAKEISRLENQMRISGSTRTVADVDTDLETLESERSGKERTRDELLRKQSRLRDEVSVLQTSWYNAKEEASRLRAAAEKQASLSQEVSNLKASNEVLRSEITEANRTVRSLRDRRDNHTADRQQKRDAARHRENETENRVRELSTLISKLEDKCRNVNAYDSSGKAEALQQLRQSMQRTADRIAEETAKLKDLRESFAEHKDKVDNSKQNQRQIEELMNFSKAVAEEDELAKKVAEIQQQLRDAGGLDDVNAAFHKAQLDAKELHKDQNIAQGRLSTIKEAAQKSQQELKSTNYANIEIRYRTQLVEFRTMELVIADLEKYHKALEKALLAFHTNKMADINKIIKELWQKTYRGQDIDYIQMKADADGARSYNYRVVMQAGGAELDMRGRCSAGQKVLACLIIRLALAETFCLNCGILALDEPTTNLDSANSASLAEALRNIMEARRGQDNFQLVIITHDENFAHLIGTREHAAYKWRITKDDNQHSKITQESIDE